MAGIFETTQKPVPKLPILLTVMVSSFLTPFTGSALILSLPDMGKHYAIEPAGMSWVIEVYLLATLLALLPMGKAADNYGRRKVFLWGNVLYMLSSLLAPLLPEYGWLLFTRGVQGLGSAMTFATNTAILALAYKGHERGWALGWNVSMVYVGLSLGPVLGGLMNHYLGWQSIFYMTAAVALFTVLLGRRYVPRSYGAVNRQSPNWQDIIPWQLLKENRLFAMSNLTAMLNYGATFAISFLLSFYLQSVLGLDSHQAGLMLLLQPLLMALLSPWAGRLSDKHSPARLCALGMGMLTAGLAALAATLHLRSIWLLLALMALMGVGFALFSAPNNNAIMGSVDKKHYSTAASMLSTVRMLGQNVSMALAALLLALPGAGRAEDAGMVGNLELAFGVFAAICAVGVYTSLARGNGNDKK